MPTPMPSNLRTMSRLVMQRLPPKRSSTILQPQNHPHLANRLPCPDQTGLMMSSPTQRIQKVIVQRRSIVLALLVCSHFFQVHIMAMLDLQPHISTALTRLARHLIMLYSMVFLDLVVLHYTPQQLDQPQFQRIHLPRAPKSLLQRRTTTSLLL